MFIDKETSPVRFRTRALLFLAESAGFGGDRKEFEQKLEMIIVQLMRIMKIQMSDNKSLILG